MSWHVCINIQYVSSQVFIMWWSLNVFNIRFLWHANTSVRQFLISDIFSTIWKLPTSFPVPSHSSHVLKSSHFFICQVSNDFEHFATISIPSKDFFIKFWLSQELPIAKMNNCETRDKISRVPHVSEYKFIHFIYIKY